MPQSSTLLNENVEAEQVASQTTDTSENDAEVREKIANLQQKISDVKSECSGIKKDLDTIFGFTTATTVASGLGTVSAGGALTSGLIKSGKDKKVEENKEKMKEILVKKAVLSANNQLSGYVPCLNDLRHNLITLKETMNSAYDDLDKLSEYVDLYNKKMDERNTRLTDEVYEKDKVKSRELDIKIADIKNQYDEREREIGEEFETKYKYIGGSRYVDENGRYISFSSVREKDKTLMELEYKYSDLLEEKNSLPTQQYDPEVSNIMDKANALQDSFHDRLMTINEFISYEDRLWFPHEQYKYSVDISNKAEAKKIIDEKKAFVNEIRNMKLIDFIRKYTPYSDTPQIAHGGLMRDACINGHDGAFKEMGYGATVEYDTHLYWLTRKYPEDTDIIEMVNKEFEAAQKVRSKISRDEMYNYEHRGESRWENLAYRDAVQNELSEEYNKLKQEVDDETKKSKTLGNVRTGLMAGATVTSAVSTGTSIGATVNADKLAKKMSDCNQKLYELKIAKAELEALESSDKSAVEVGENATKILGACTGYNKNNINTVKNKMTASAIISGIGTATGATGTITSAMANSKKVREDDSEKGKKKEKNLNLTANIMAGITTGTSLSTTVISATAIADAKKDSKMAEECEAVLK